LVSILDKNFANIPEKDTKLRELAVRCRLYIKKAMQRFASLFVVELPEPQLWFRLTLYAPINALILNLLPFRTVHMNENRVNFLTVILTVKLKCNEN